MTFDFRSRFSIFRLLGLLALAFSVVGCSRISQEAQRHQLQIELVEPLFPPAVGNYTLTIRLFDGNDQPIDDATITVKGDMTHAGMVPILAETSGGDKGLYKVPFEWTMGGDWVVVVQATLPDGTIAEKSFPLTISGDPGDCDTEDANTP